MAYPDGGHHTKQSDLERLLELVRIDENAPSIDWNENEEKINSLKAKIEDSIEDSLKWKKYYESCGDITDYVKELEQQNKELKKDAETRTDNLNLVHQALQDMGEGYMKLQQKLEKIEELYDDARYPEDFSFQELKRILGEKE